jgi:hypothetical protein
MCKNTGLLIIPNHTEHNNFAAGNACCKGTASSDLINLINHSPNQPNQPILTNDNISKRKN